MAKKQTEGIEDSAAVEAVGAPVVEPAPLGEEVSYEKAAAWWKSGRTEEEAAAMLSEYSAGGKYFIPHSQ